MTFTFVGPVFYEKVPLEAPIPYSSLVQEIPYGMTVWRDPQGLWHTKYAPTPTDLAGADRIYGGGRVYVLTQAQHDELITAGYGAYITSDSTDNSSLVGTALVGTALVG